MGFKDLEKFNDVMLAEQVWRLLRDQNSLFFRVFKSKYFPRGSVLEASISSGSFAWKSIMKARKVILKGMGWRIGDGKSINIYGDNWLPGEGSPKIISPQAPELKGAKLQKFRPSYLWIQVLGIRIFYTSISFILKPKELLQSHCV